TIAVEPPRSPAQMERAVKGLVDGRYQWVVFTQTATGVEPDDEHGGLMVLRLDPSVVPDLAVGVTCMDRPGDAW
ncbi:hypothetical protein, partial [Nocardia salmonicida]|uniref:hypothetical protein n=1 Tax=Nocardia salmonicida TaxID=53431 RepID=UPI0033CEA639